MNLSDIVSSRIENAWNERDEETRRRNRAYQVRVYEAGHSGDHYWHAVSYRHMDPVLRQGFGEIMAGRAYEVLLAGGGVGIGDLQFRMARS